jgi:hypothetical protein
MGTGHAKIKKKDTMKHKSSIKPNKVISGSDKKPSPAQPAKSGVLKRFLAWIAMGSKNTCPT